MSDMSDPENAFYEDVNKRTIEIPQRTRILKANYCLKFATYISS